jgi:hypothetical protein
MENDEKDQGGRPSLFDPKYIEQAEKLCKLGATDAELADFFGVSVRTLHRWKAENEEFCHSIKLGKDVADTRVERALYEKATGFAYTEEQAFKVRNSDGSETLETIEVERLAPPDTTAMIFWLKNRKKSDWRDKIEQELTGADGGPVRIVASPLDDCASGSMPSSLRL